MSKFLEGKKTYAGIVAIIAGYLGIGDILTPETTSVIFDNILQLVGIIVAIYGRYNTKK